MAQTAEPQPWTGYKNHITPGNPSADQAMKNQHTPTRFFQPDRFIIDGDFSHFFILSILVRDNPHRYYLLTALFSRVLVSRVRRGGQRVRCQQAINNGHFTQRFTGQV